MMDKMPQGLVPDILYNKRAEYGKQIVINLSLKLTERYGSGWSEKTLRHCLRSAETFSEEDIVSATQRQLTWTHLKSLMYIKDPLERQFYAQMCSAEHWDTRTLDEKIDKQLYLQTALSRKPEEVIKKELEDSSQNKVSEIVPNELAQLPENEFVPNGLAQIPSVLLALGGHPTDWCTADDSLPTERLRP